MSMSDMYESSVSRADEARLEEGVRPQPGQVGYFAYVREGFAGADVFGSTDLCSAKLAKLLRGHYLDALDSYVEFPRLTVEQVLEQLRGAEPEQFQGVGKGAELRFEAAGVQGACKLVGEAIPHLALFPKLN